MKYFPFLALVLIMVAVLVIYNTVKLSIFSRKDLISSLKLIGATNPEDAEEGTIRKLFATSIEANAIHGSDSDENAEIEINFFFN